LDQCVDIDRTDGLYFVRDSSQWEDLVGLSDSWSEEEQVAPKTEVVPEVQSWVPREERKSLHSTGSDEEQMVPEVAEGTKDSALHSEGREESLQSTSRSSGFRVTARRRSSVSRSSSVGWLQFQRELLWTV
jgi:hypothetical protein